MKIVGFNLGIAPFRQLSTLLACLIEEKKGCVITLPGNNGVIQDMDDLKGGKVSEFMVNESLRKGAVVWLREDSVGAYSLHTEEPENNGKEKPVCFSLQMLLEAL